MFCAQFQYDSFLCFDSTIHYSLFSKVVNLSIIYKNMLAVI